MAFFICETDPGNDGNQEFRVEASSPEQAARKVWSLYPQARALCEHSNLMDPGEEAYDDPTHPEYPWVGKKVAWLHVTQSDLPVMAATPARAFDDRYWAYTYIRFESGRIEWFGSDN